MTREELIQMANDAELGHEIWIDNDDKVLDTLERFAQLVAAAEREACAKLIEDSWMAFSRRSNRLDITPFPELDYVAKVIRARGSNADT